MLGRSSEEETTPSSLAETGERRLVIGGDSPIRLAAGHRLRHHDGKCARPHGHNYAITVELTGTLTEEGWIVDKGVVTSIVDRWDHAFLVEAGDPLVEAFEASGDDDALVVLEHPPTAEVMAITLERTLLEELPDNVADARVTVRETEELCAR